MRKRNIFERKTPENNEKPVFSKEYRFSLSGGAGGI